MTFSNAVLNQSARTTNGMKARVATSDSLVDFFYNAGAMRGRDIIPLFSAAYAQDKELALRLAQWLRDVRGGAGERKLFRDIVVYLEKVEPDAAIFLLYKAKELGRWDDVIETPTTEFVKTFAFAMAYKALVDEKNGLAAKWMPRKGPLAAELRKFFGLQPKEYRKLIVSLSNTVEQKMCDKQWEAINFSHVPSVALSNYRKAFAKNAPDSFKAWLESLKKGEKGVKVNAGAVYPYDVLKGVNSYTRSMEVDAINEQWKALPNYVGDASILPLVDVSGSMGSPAGADYKSNLTCMHVAISLGLYLADKNKGAFKDVFCTFSGRSELIKLNGNNIFEKYSQLSRAHWEMNTNLHAAFENILKVAKEGSVSPEDMPKILLILSDMQFDSCARYDDSAVEMIARKYENAGYEMPKVVFWNLNASGNAPTSSRHKDVGLVSGFSPAIVKSVLSAKDFTPYGIMMKTLSNPRYDISLIN